MIFFTLCNNESEPAKVASEASELIILPTQSLIFLVVLGGLAAQAEGAPITIGAFRVTFWGALAMGLTAAVGRLFGVVV